MNKKDKNQKENILISVDNKRGFTLKTPVLQNDYIDRFKELFPRKKSISLIEVFDTVNQSTDFLSYFTPFDYECEGKRPDNIYFYATLIAKTKRKSLDKIAEQQGIDPIELEDTFRIYFTDENLLMANKRITEFIDSLKISAISDTGASQYYFIEKNNLLFRHTNNPATRQTVLCCSELEFPYALDRLLGNVTSPVEEEYTLIRKPKECIEVLFGIADLLGYSYAIRILDFGQYKIYGTGDQKNLQHIKLDAIADMNLIGKNWDDILRFAATIKTGYTPVSILIPKIVNRFEHPIFLGLRELGRAVQTIFILKYIDNLELRQTIEIHFEKAKYHQELSKTILKPRREAEFITYENRIMNDSCKTLIENCIMAWNCLYLSNKLREQASDTEELTRIIKHGFIPVWEHIEMIN